MATIMGVRNLNLATLTNHKFTIAAVLDIRDSSDGLITPVLSWAGTNDPVGFRFYFEVDDPISIGHLEVGFHVYSFPLEIPDGRSVYFLIGGDGSGGRPTLAVYRYRVDEKKRFVYEGPAGFESILIPSLTAPFRIGNESDAGPFAEMEVCEVALFRGVIAEATIDELAACLVIKWLVGGPTTTPSPSGGGATVGVYLMGGTYEAGEEEEEEEDYYLLHFGSGSDISVPGYDIVNGTTEADGFVVFYRRDTSGTWCLGEVWESATDHSSTLQTHPGGSIDLEVFNHVGGVYVAGESYNLGLSLKHGIKFGRMARRTPFKVVVTNSVNSTVLTWYSVGTPERAGGPSGSGILPFPSTISGVFYDAFSVTTENFSEILPPHQVTSSSGTYSALFEIFGVNSGSHALTGGITGYTFALLRAHYTSGTLPQLVVLLKDGPGFVVTSNSSTVLVMIQGTVTLATAFRYPTGQQIPGYSSGAGLNSTPNFAPI